ncbi:MAG: hypothetical protein BGN88_11530 [Clostridiales bacterium 43-6]|nr:MAG: hypothetical protein BGN88_11530 [Clostridiales bacterium 43-6]
MERLLGNDIDVAALSPGALAFVGDAVFSLMVSEDLAKKNRPSGALHSISVTRVNAVAQAAGYKKIEAQLTEQEIAVYKRGRNLNVHNIPRGATPGQYHSATGLEALFGYLYLSNEIERLREIFYLLSDEC